MINKYIKEQCETKLKELEIYHPEILAIELPPEVEKEIRENDHIRSGIILSNTKNDVMFMSLYLAKFLNDTKEKGINQDALYMRAYQISKELGE